MKKIILLSILLLSLLSADAFAEGFEIKGNIQTQLTKSTYDGDNNLSGAWMRANFGGQYSSENLDGLIMLRMFAPEFGNTIEGNKHDKILADLYWARYSIGENLKFKMGRWKTDWSQSTHFGTYIDKDLTSRGMWMRDYSHNAIETEISAGPSSTKLMLATLDNKANTGYLRIEEKLSLPVETLIGYRVNAIDPVQNTSYVTHRLSAFAKYKFIERLSLYGEIALIYTQDDELETTANNYVPPEQSYLEPGNKIIPMYGGVSYSPKSGLLGILTSDIFLELEYIGERARLYNQSRDIDDVAWVVAISKNIGKSKIQFSAYSEDEIKDIGLAFRITATFN